MTKISPLKILTSFNGKFLAIRLPIIYLCIKY